MGARPIPTQRVPGEGFAAHKPRLPTVVAGIFKGGCLKTTFAVALAERLAWAGLHVLLLTSDAQHDARFRLGVKPSDPQTARVVRGKGSVTVRGVRPSKAVELLYGPGPGELG
jgi:cellulose biosynthesis protein BcsQ